MRQKVVDDARADGSRISIEVVDCGLIFGNTCRCDVVIGNRLAGSRIVNLTVVHRLESRWGHPLMNQAVGFGELLDRVRIIEQLAEIALTHQSSRYREEIWIDGLHFSESLIIAKTEELVLDEWAANGEAGLIAVQRRIRAGRSSEKAIAGIRIKLAAAIEPEGRTMNLVGAALDGCRDNGPARPAILCWRYAGIHLELVGCIDVRKDDDGI